MGFFEFINSIDWEQESYQQYGDFIVLPFFTVFFPTVRFLLDRFVFQKVGSLVIYGNQQVVENETDERKKKLRKFKESAWKCIYYLSAEILALAVTYDEPGFKKTKYFWTGPGEPTFILLKEIKKSGYARDKSIVGFDSIGISGDSWRLYL